MSLAERLRVLASALPTETAIVSLTRRDLMALVEGAEEVNQGSGRDLSVEEVAEETGRAPSTVRGWLIEGALRGYKLNGKSWRIPRSALREYLGAQAAHPPSLPAADTDPVDISAWRRVQAQETRASRPAPR